MNFACKVIPPGRPFLQSMIQLTRNVSLLHHCIKLSKGFVKDLRMWEDFICNWNRAGFFMQSHWVTSDVLSLYTDASGSLGFGDIFQTHWFQGSWEPHQKLGQPGSPLHGKNCLPLLLLVIYGPIFSQTSTFSFSVTMNQLSVLLTQRGPASQGSWTLFVI